jgi:hypothetical protein
MRISVAFDDAPDCCCYRGQLVGGEVNCRHKPPSFLRPRQVFRLELIGYGKRQELIRYGVSPILGLLEPILFEPRRYDSRPIRQLLGGDDDKPISSVPLERPFPLGKPRVGRRRASYRLVQKRISLVGRERPQTRVLVDGIHCPSSGSSHIFLRRIGAQYPHRNFDEVNPKLFVLAGVGRPGSGKDAGEGEDA